MRDAMLGLRPSDEIAFYLVNDTYRGVIFTQALGSGIIMPMRQQ